MQFIKEHCDCQCLEFFSYEVNETNPVGAAFILMMKLDRSHVH